MHIQLSAEQRQRVEKWIVRLREAGLDGLAGMLVDIGEPLGPLGAQMLLVAQPALSLITSVSRDDINGLADLLDDPAGIAWLRSELIGSEDEDQ
jgi:hypothetical protein